MLGPPKSCPGVRRFEGLYRAQDEAALPMTQGPIAQDCSARGDSSSAHAATSVSVQSTRLPLPCAAPSRLPS